MAATALASVNELERWTFGKPVEWASILAFRASLRTLPFIVEFESYRALPEYEKAEVYLAVFRSAYSCWASLNYPRTMTPRMVARAARATNRVVGRAAGSSGAESAARAGYAIADAARAAGSQELQYAVRSIENSMAVGDAAIPSAPALLWAEIESDAIEFVQRTQGDIDPAQIVLGRRLWNVKKNAPWPRVAFVKLERALQRHAVLQWEFWLKWYSARAKGTSEYGLSDRWLEEIAFRISQEDDNLWEGGYEELNARILSWINEALLREDGKQKTTAEFIVEYLDKIGQPAAVKEITEAFSKVRRNVVPKSVRGDLSRLASSGQIVRIASGVYRSSGLKDLSIFEAGEVEPQTRGAIQFAAYENAPIAVASRASAGELRSDASARRRHGEVLRRADTLLSRYSRTEQGGNTSSAIVEEVDLFRSSLGPSIDDVDPDLLIPRGDGLRRDLSAHQNKDDFSKLSAIPDDLLLSLEKLVSDYNNFVSFDPELARRDEALLGPDARRKLVPPSEGQRVLEDAASLQAATQEVVTILYEEAKIAPDVPDPESRQSRRYSEGVKNFARVAIERAIELAKVFWKHKGKGATGAVFSYAAAKWVIANELWLLKYFSANPAMSDIIAKLLKILHTLPLG